jgi:hypothetical protein
MPELENLNFYFSALLDNLVKDILFPNNINFIMIAWIKLEEIINNDLMNDRNS